MDGVMIFSRMATLLQQAEVLPNILCLPWVCKVKVCGIANQRLQVLIRLPNKGCQSYSGNNVNGDIHTDSKSNQPGGSSGVSGV